MDNPDLQFACSNENPAAIIAGLDVHSEDHVLTVGGSGDQAFALLERAGAVIVTDNNPAQIAFIRQRASSLLENNNALFFANLRDFLAPKKLKSFLAGRKQGPRVQISRISEFL